jgi:DNA-binding transcriptional ArsR family regulator
LTGPVQPGTLPFVAAYRSEEAWNALGDPSRRAIVQSLAERPRAVGELAEALPISRPAVSQHLRVLKEAGLVTERAAGTRRIYRLNPTGVAALRDQLDTYWNRALAGYQDTVASPDITDPVAAPGAGGEQDVTRSPGQDRS